MILKQGHKYLAMPHDGKVIQRIYRGGRCYYKDSPYSLAATQALKAAFPQYWTAILDYGYAHPQLVPFINEDPMLIVSLVEVGKMRGLHTSNGAKIFTNYIPLTTDLVRVTLKINADTISVPYGTRNTAGATDGGAFYVYTNNTKHLRIDWATSNTSDFVNIEIDKYFTIEHKKGYCVINGNVVFNKSVSAINAKHPLYLFSLNNAGVSNSLLPNITINEVYCEDKLHLVPCQHGGESGMLDIVSLTFYPNANTEGQFTIQLTDK